MYAAEHKEEPQMIVTSNEYSRAVLSIPSIHYDCCMNSLSTVL